jgi:hypothetical protein
MRRSSSGVSGGDVVWNKIFSTPRHLVDGGPFAGVEEGENLLASCFVGHLCVSVVFRLVRFNQVWLHHEDGEAGSHKICQVESGVVVQPCCSLSSSGQ